uniref:C2H2-type domain-containing protein n=1 Tax=Timspurckia oligopyrenoides TaxID=708627 RepID=A0A7S0ZLN0_9RHOD|mmetsp:Transcript_9385/g.16939  ORF Transcript_9385/g.16939 Transcript_9385/m.16939 type:complete len:277 (+) Transcript_9385:3-833(+)
MGRKKRKHEDEERIFCWYCDRTFQDERVLIIHQKEKHFRCPQCSKKLHSLNGLCNHSQFIHRITITNIPHALSERDDTSVNVIGMSGIPEDPKQATKEPQIQTENNNNAPQIPPLQSIPSLPVTPLPHGMPYWNPFPNTFPNIFPQFPPNPYMISPQQMPSQPPNQLFPGTNPLPIPSPFGYSSYPYSSQPNSYTAAAISANSTGTRSEVNQIHSAATGVSIPENTSKEEDENTDRKKIEIQSKPVVTLVFDSVDISMEEKRAALLKYRKYLKQSA